MSTVLEQHWEAKATAKVGVEGLGAEAEASAGGSARVETNFEWEKNTTTQKMRGHTETVQIDAEVLSGKRVRLLQKHQEQDMLIQTQVLAVLRPAFYVVDYRENTGLFEDSSDHGKWGKAHKSRIICVMHDFNDIYDLVTGRNSRYPKQRKDLTSNKSVKAALDFFDDADTRTIIESRERLIQDVDSTEYDFDESAA